MRVTVPVCSIGTVMYVSAISQTGLRTRSASAKGKPWELYDLANDRSELIDLSKKRPQDAEDLRNLWHQVAEEVEGAPEKLRKPIR